MSEKTEKFKDQGARIFDFSDEFLVECSKCGAMARVVVRSEDTRDVPLLYRSRKLVCAKCGLARYWDERQVAGYTTNASASASKGFPVIGGKGFLVIGGNFDWYFRRPLWLQTDCCGETLWALNARHLEFIENYVAARLRERTPGINRSLISRLPQWLKNAKNRDEILRAIGKLREKLNGKS